MSQKKSPLKFGRGCASSMEIRITSREDNLYVYKPWAAVAWSLPWERRGCGRFQEPDDQLWITLNKWQAWSRDTQPLGKSPGKNYLLNIAESWRWLRTEVGRKVEKEEEEEEQVEDPPTWNVWLSSVAQGSWIVLSRMKMLKTEKKKEPGEGVELNRWGRYKANLNQCELKWRDHVHSPLMHRWGSNQPAVAQTP